MSFGWTRWNRSRGSSSGCLSWVNGFVSTVRVALHRTLGVGATGGDGIPGPRRST